VHTLRHLHRTVGLHNERGESVGWVCQIMMSRDVMEEVQRGLLDLLGGGGSSASQIGRM
jgi:hypothetical protein